MHQVSPGDKEALVFRKCFHDVCKIPSVAFQAYAWVQFKVSVKMFPPKKTLHFLGAEKMDFAFKRTVFFLRFNYQTSGASSEVYPRNRQVELNNLRHCAEAAEEPLWRHAAPGSVAWPWCRQYHIKHYKAI